MPSPWYWPWWQPVHPTEPFARTALAATSGGAGAPIDAIDNRGRTALMIAAELGHGDVVDLLLGRGADRSIADKSGQRAQDLAANDGIRAKLGAR